MFVMQQHVDHVRSHPNFWQAELSVLSRAVRFVGRRMGSAHCERCDLSVDEWEVHTASGAKNRSTNGKCTLQAVRKIGRNVEVIPRRSVKQLLSDAFGKSNRNEDGPRPQRSENRTATRTTRAHNDRKIEPQRERPAPTTTGLSDSSSGGIHIRRTESRTALAFESTRAVRKVGRL